MVRPRFALHAGPRARAHSHPPHSPPLHARTLGHSPASLRPGGLAPAAPRSDCSRAHRPGLRPVGEGWARAAAAAAERSSPPPAFRGPGGSAQ